MTAAGFRVLEHDIQILMAASKVMPPGDSAPDTPLHNLLFPISLHRFTLEGFMNTPPGYEKKFAGFIQMCSEAKAKGITDRL